MRHYLLPISDREPLAWILGECRTAFPAHRQREAQALVVGDKLLLYTTRGCFRNPTRDRGRIVGVATVRRPARELDAPVQFGDREFPYLVELAIDVLAPRGEGVELAPLVPELPATFSNPEAWSATMRRALVPLAEDDGTRLVRLLERRHDSKATSSYAAAIR